MEIYYNNYYKNIYLLKIIIQIETIINYIIIKITRLNNNINFFIYILRVKYFFRVINFVQLFNFAD